MNNRAVFVPHRMLRGLAVPELACCDDFPPTTTECAKQYLGAAVRVRYVTRFDYSVCRHSKRETLVIGGLCILQLDAVRASTVSAIKFCCRIL
mmetsp:Transcript_3464/g.9470  ORF Transcript_3464/g.9470 Transcript_3464/m.9470 type:complete len:93 (+) Transcript_3464:980-1258(+)